MRKKILLLSVLQDGENYLVSGYLAKQRSVELELGPEQARLLCLALMPSLSSATLESIGRDIANMLSDDAFVIAEIPVG